MEQRRRCKIARRHFRIGWQAVYFGFIDQQIERVQAAENLIVRAIQVGALFASLLQLLYPFLRSVAQIADFAELDRLGRASFRASRFHPDLETIVTEGALLGGARYRINFDHSKGTGGDTVATAVARVRLDHHGIEFGASDGSRGTHFEARRLHAVLAHVTHQEPAPVLPSVGKLLDEFYVPPVDAVEPTGIVIAVTAQGVNAAVGAGQLIPFLAGDFARLAANADGSVGVESHGLSHKHLKVGLSNEC